jgi:hypothetical protein
MKTVLTLTLLLIAPIVGFGQGIAGPVRLPYFFNGQTLSIAGPQPELLLKDTGSALGTWRIRLVDDKFSIERSTDAGGNFDTYSVALTLDPATGYVFLPRVNINGTLQLAGPPGASQIRFGNNVDLQSNTNNQGPTFATNTGPTITTLFRREVFSATGTLAYLKGEGLNSEGGSYSPQWLGFSTRNNRAGQESGYFEFGYMTNGQPLLEKALFVGDLGDGFPYRVWISQKMLVSADAQFDGETSVRTLKIGETTLSEDDVKQLLDLLKSRQ